MNIDLVDNYVLTSDPHNFILNERLTTQEGKNKGKQYLSVVGFYPTIAQALRGLVTKKLRNSDLTSAKDLLQAHTELTERIEGMFQVLKG